MALALFDLDNTLLAGDSDYSWGQFLIEQNAVSKAEYEQANQYFYAQYESGDLDIYEFARFAFKPLADHSLADLEHWRSQFVATKIQPIMLEKGKEAIAWHTAQGHELAIITATNSFVTAPIAKDFGIKHLIATEPEMKDDRYTGEIAGVPCFKEGKVTRLQSWMKEQKIKSLEQSWFYSDSHNDLPLLESVANPIAVDPDDVLREVAEQRNWKVLSFRN